MAETTLGWAAQRFARALTPLSNIADDAATVERSLAFLGWTPPPGVDLSHVLAFDVGDLITKLEVVLNSTPSEQSDVLLMASRYADLVTAAGKVVTEIETVATELPDALKAAGDYASKTNIALELPRRLLDLLLVAAAETGAPLVGHALRLIGLFRAEHHPADPTIYQVKHTRAVVDYPRLPKLISDPAGTIAADYGWHTAAFDAERLIANIGWVLQGVGFRPVLVDMDPRAEARIGNAPTATDKAPNPQLRVELLRAIGELTADAGLSIHRLRSTQPDAADAGLEMALYLRGSSDVNIPLFGPLSLLIDTKLDLEEGVGLAIRPTGIALRSGLFGTSTSPAAGSLDLGLQVGPPDGTSFTLLKVDGGSAVHFASAYVAAGGGLAAGGTADASVRAGLLGCTVTVATGAADGFLQTALPKELKASFDIRVRWSKLHGLSFEGAGGLALDIPVNAGTGAIQIQALHVAVEAGTAQGPRVRVGGDVAIALGPISASVQGMGMRATLAVPAGGGHVHPHDLQIGFAPPTGVGLAIDSPAVRGGGFLSFDVDAGRYAGVFELTLVSTVSVKAIAIITTKKPDGTAGFALLIIITADGFTPVPLGFGFELTGIGGLLALNRTVNADAVRNGLRDGVVDSVLFPKDPVHNANRIISTLDKIFPLAPDRLMIGPLAEIGWGTPPIVKIRLALLLEVPKPIRAILLATLSALLPNEKAAVVELHVDAIGVLDLSRGELALDASLHDSRILQFTLSGDMALRLNWGNEPTFLLSVGGFHPKYPPPVGLRPLNRLSLSLSSGNPSVRLECYFAITSNSVQFGARVTLSAEIAEFGVNGGGAFDALIQWSPFTLDVSMQAWVRITAGGATLLAATISAEISGPQPWHVHGTASISFLFFSVTVHINFTIGASAAPPPVDTVDVAALLWDEVGRAAAWQAALPAARSSGATLAAPAGAPADAVVVHPLATVSLRQKVAPLDTQISRVGARVPKGGTRSYQIDVAAPAGVVVGDLKELFARAQFQDVSDDAKLTAPSFEAFPAGVTLAPANATRAAQNGVTSTDLSFETLDITSFDVAATPAGRAPALAASALAPNRGPGNTVGTRAAWQLAGS